MTPVERTRDLVDRLERVDCQAFAAVLDVRSDLRATADPTIYALAFAYFAADAAYPAHGWHDAA